MGRRSLKISNQLNKHLVWIIKDKGLPPGETYREV
jgi:hypothetical protein